MAGAYGSEVLGGMFIFKNVSAEEVEQYVKDDPYTQNGLITGYKVCRSVTAYTYIFASD